MKKYLLLLIFILFLTFTLIGNSAVVYKGISEWGGNKTAYLMAAPANIAEVGDLLIAYIGKDDNTAIDTTGAYGSWNMLVNEIGDGQTCLYLAWKWAAAGDTGGSPTEYTWDDTSTNEEWTGTILVYSGAAEVPIYDSGSDYLATSATPTAPSVAFTDLAAGSLVFQSFVCDFEDGPRTLAGQLESRFNIQEGTAVGGAGGDRACPENHWVSPSGFNDPDTEWSTEERAYDGVIGTTLNRATTTDVVPQNTWTGYLELTIDPISCSKVRFYSTWADNGINSIILEVYFSGGWHEIYEGAYASNEWVEKPIGSTQTVEAMRMKYHAVSATVHRVFLYEASFWKIESATGDTGTAVFGIPSSNEWSAATLVIEAEAEVPPAGITWNGITISKWNGVAITIPINTQ